MLLAINSALLIPDSANVRLVNSVSSRKYGLRFLAVAYFLHLFWRKTAIPMIEAALRAPLSLHVLYVFCMRSYFEMRRVNARRIVAGVHDYFAARYCAHKEAIHIPMGVSAMSPTVFSGSDNSVSESRFISSPEPASRRFLYPGFYGHRSNNPLVFCKVTASELRHIASPTETTAGSSFFANLALHFTLFHGCARRNGPTMTLP